MALSKLDSFYMAVVSDHSKHPHHRGKVADAEVLELHNPTCGDVIELSLRIDADGKIADIAFDGAGCTISTASASMMTEAMQGKTVAEVDRLFDRVHAMLAEDGPADAVGNLKVLSGAREFPMRVKCATLAWHTLRAALDNHSETVTTEEAVAACPQPEPRTMP